MIIIINFFLNFLTLLIDVTKEGDVTNKQVFYSLTLGRVIPPLLDMRTKYTVATPDALCQQKVPSYPLPLGLLCGFSSLQSFHFHLCSGSRE